MTKLCISILLFILIVIVIYNICHYTNERRLRRQCLHEDTHLITDLVERYGVFRIICRTCRCKWHEDSETLEKVEFNLTMTKEKRESIKKSKRLNDLYHQC